MKYSIALIDDHALFRKGIKGIIDEFINFEVVSEWENGKEFTDQLSEENAPDIAIVDINMPVMDGYRTTSWLKEHFPSIRVLALSVNNDELSIIRMMRAGARGYILKDAEPEDLETGLEEIASRGFYYSTHVGEILLSEIQDPAAPDELAEQEIEFLRLACTELTYKEIAEQMHRSPRTIDGYREVLCKKLNLKSRVGLVIYAIRNGIYRV